MTGDVICAGVVVVVDADGTGGCGRESIFKRFGTRDDSLLVKPFFPTALLFKYSLFVENPQPLLHKTQ
jgi:hypothetical protein